MWQDGEEGWGSAAKSRTSEWGTHTLEDKHCCRSSHQGAMGLNSTLGSPALGSCPGKMSPRTFVSEGQQGLVLGLQFQRTVGKRNPTLTGRTQNLMLQDPGQKHQWVNTSLRTSAALQSAVVGPSPPTNRPAWALAHLALLPTRGPTPALRHCGPIGQPPGV